LGMKTSPLRAFARSKQEELYDHFKYRAKNFLGRADLPSTGAVRSSHGQENGTR